MSDTDIDITMLLLRAYVAPMQPRPRIVRMMDGLYVLTYNDGHLVSYRRLSR